MCVFRPPSGAARCAHRPYRQATDRLWFPSVHLSFPLIVPGAMMIEPTESASKAELDAFIDAMLSIAREVEEDPELVMNAPHTTRVSRLDEALAARKPVLRWKP